MNFIDLLDIANNYDSLPTGTLTEVFFELLEAGYDLILLNGSWALVDDCTYSRPWR